MLFEPLQLRSLEVRHRGWVSPMCQYSCDADNTPGRQAELILRTGQADGVFIGRAALADPRWWQRAAHQLGYDLPWVPPYQWPQPQNAY